MSQLIPRLSDNMFHVSRGICAMACLLATVSRAGRIDKGLAASLHLRADLDDPRFSSAEKDQDVVGDAQQLRHVSLSQTQASLAKELVDMAEWGLSLPVQVAFDGGHLFKEKLAVAVEGVENATISVVDEAERGNYSGILPAASEAILKASFKSAALDEEATTSASRAFCILMVVFILGSCWALEALLSAHYDTQKVENVSMEERSNDHVVVEKELRARHDSKHFIHSLSFVKYLAAIWFIVDQTWKTNVLYTSQGDPWGIFARWGCMAPPFFFMCSGFTNSYSQLVGPDLRQEKNFFSAMLTRVVPWYPLFFFSLLVCAIIYPTADAESWSHFMANSFLVHRLLFSGEHFPFLTQDWPLCFLMVYLLLWLPVHSAFKESTNNMLWSFFSLTVLAVIPIVTLEWYCMVDVPVFILLSFWPGFAFGQALAVWFVKTCMEKQAIRANSAQSRVLFPEVFVLRHAKELPPLVRFGPTLGLFVLGVQAFIYSPNDTVWMFNKSLKPLVTKGLFLPVLGIMIAGFACNADPISKLFSRTPFRWSERLVCATYILSIPVVHAFSAVSAWHGFSFVYFVVLFFSALILHTLLEQPWRAYLGIRAR
uniref:Uncharacterized protein n=1 Tax=Noctiluca scintillans TaxID=2966 RepID=A0A7S1EWB9_NOCSC|mmetsp:Transcript_1446/g.3896  ORF Transcript_1446/g.3896 Transcript_1446/m.3896 type:complete len:598 (+) Transcript_1446:118-1911(+)